MANMLGRLPDYIAPPPPANDDEEPTLPPVLEPGVLTQESQPLPFMGPSAPTPTYGDVTSTIQRNVNSGGPNPLTLLGGLPGAAGFLGQGSGNALMRAMVNPPEDSMIRGPEGEDLRDPREKAISGASEVPVLGNLQNLVRNYSYGPGRPSSYQEMFQPPPNEPFLDLSPMWDKNKEGQSMGFVPRAAQVLMNVAPPVAFVPTVVNANTPKIAKIGAGILGQDIQNADVLPRKVTIPEGLDRYGISSIPGEPSIINQPAETIAKAAMPGEAPIGFPFNWGSKRDDLPEAARDAYPKSQGSEFPLSDNTLKTMWDSRGAENRQALGKSLEDRGLFEPPTEPPTAAHARPEGLPEPGQFGGNGNPPPGGPPRPPSPPEPPVTQRTPSEPSDNITEYGAVQRVREGTDIPAPLRQELTDNPIGGPAPRNTEVARQAAETRLNSEGVDAVITRLKNTENWGDNEAFDAEAVRDYFMRQPDGGVDDYLDFYRDFGSKRREIARALQAGNAYDPFSPQRVISTQYDLIDRAIENGVDPDDIAKGLDDAQKAVATRKATDTANRGRQAARNMLDEAGEIEAGTRRSTETSRSKSARSSLMKDIDRMESEGRLPADLPGDPDPLAVRWADFKKRIDEAGWNLDHEIAKDVRAQVQAAELLKGDERVQAFNAIKQSILDDYYDAVVKESDTYRTAATYSKRASGVIDKLSSLWRSKDVAAYLPEEITKLKEMEAAARKVEKAWPAATREKFVNRMQTIEAMSPGKQRLDAIKRFINEMYDESMPELRQQVAYADEARANVTKIEKTVEALQGPLTKTEKVDDASSTLRQSLDRVRSLSQRLGEIAPEDMEVVVRGESLPVDRHLAAANAMLDGPDKVQYTREIGEAIVNDMLPRLEQLAEYNSKEASRLRKMGLDYQYLTDTNERQAKERITSDYTQIVRQAKKAAKDANSVMTPEWAKDILARANEMERITDPVEKELFRRRLAQDITEAIPSSFKENITDALGLPRTIKGGPDISMPLRQGMLGIADKEWWQSLKPMLESAASKDAYELSQAIIATSPRYDEAVKAGLAINDVGGKVNMQEGTLVNKLVKSIPVYGELQEASGRNAATFLNTYRIKKYENMIDMLEGMGHELTDTERQTIARYINSKTGRGSLGDIDNSNLTANILGNVFWSTRLPISRFQAPLMAMKSFISLVPGAQKVAPFLYSQPVAVAIAQDAARNTAAIMSALALAKLSGLEVEMDPRSKQFAQVRFPGGTYVDMTGGTSQAVALIAQLGMGLIGQAQLLQGGEPIHNFKGQDGISRFESPGDVLGGYIRNKLGPAASPISDFIFNGGRDFLGREYTFSTTADMAMGKDVSKKAGYIENVLGPMLLNNIPEAFQKYGLVGASAIFAGQMAGLGINTYDNVGKLADEKAKALGYESLEKAPPSVRDKIGSDPEIKKLREEMDPRFATDRTLIEGAQRTMTNAHKLAESELADILSKPNLSGESLRNGIKSYYEKINNTARSAYTDDVKKAQSRSDSRRQSLADQYRDEYRSVPLEFNNEGEPDFKKRDAAKQEILKAAVDAGVPESEIKFKSYSNITDPKVRSAIMEYDLAQDMLKPYWKVREGILDKNPKLADLYDKWQSANSTERQALQRQPAWKLVEKMRESITEANRAYLRKNPNIAKLLDRYSYPHPSLTTKKGFY